MAISSSLNPHYMDVEVYSVVDGNKIMHNVQHISRDSLNGVWRVEIAQPARIVASPPPGINEDR